MFDFAEATKEMSAAEILNYYRNLYYTEPQVTERGIMANAINDYLTADVQEVKHAKWEWSVIIRSNAQIVIMFETPGHNTVGIFAQLAAQRSI